MAKIKSVWYCQECGTKATKWAGQCFGCSSWNSLVEEKEAPASFRRFESVTATPSKPVQIHNVTKSQAVRHPSSLNEFDRLIGGGLVRGSFTLIGGYPGIGKSTLLLQLSERFASKGLTILYVSGEESIEQTSLRAKRLGVSSERIFLLNETLFSTIRSHVETLKPDILIIDSIQVVYKGEIQSAPGSVSQVRETAAEFMHLSKSLGVATILVGHVTKSGEIAGPKVLEHLVDTVLYFEGEKETDLRMIRVIKNRFGPTDEIAVFQMSEGGLQEVQNPSMLFLEQRRKNVIGSIITPTLEGSRPILVEVQALITSTVFPAPSRKSTGVDPNRLALLLAVMEKRLGCPLYQFDVFVSVAGGLKIVEPSLDLAMLVAAASSLFNAVTHTETVVMGEVGLSGEVRSVARIEQRLKEAINLGFQRAVIPHYHMKTISKEIKEKLELLPVEMVDEAVSHLIPESSRKIKLRSKQPAGAFH